MTELEPGVLEACRQSHPTALRKFVETYQDLVFAYLSRTLGHGPHVEDLAQEAFLRAFQALPRFRPEGAARVSTWLLTIASRLGVDFRRKFRPHLDLAGEAIASTVPTPELEHTRHELRIALSRAVADLSDEQRDAYVLAEIHGLSTAELAQVLGVAENTAKARLFRARDRLRSVLSSFWEER